MKAPAFMFFMLMISCCLYVGSVIALQALEFEALGQMYLAIGSFSITAVLWTAGVFALPAVYLNHFHYHRD